jgi:hypothetical protein
MLGSVQLERGGSSACHGDSNGDGERDGKDDRDSDR